MPKVKTHHWAGVTLSMPGEKIVLAVNAKNLTAKILLNPDPLLLQQLRHGAVCEVAVTIWGIGSGVLDVIEKPGEFLAGFL